eukprot:GHUV01030231.1.p1 GENE.GHUV01030231.1~~GHUV01030231.1.p1  ORF type:complete len:118 (+),score=1.30 GHUV01030231.1:463-816(+)
MNHATKAFFKSGHGIALAVYDTRRGQQEGREVEKILAFYPPTTPAATQSSIVGLAQALTMFAGTFNKVYCGGSGPVYNATCVTICSCTEDLIHSKATSRCTAGTLVIVARFPSGVCK